MALVISTEYTHAQAPDTFYPQGSFKNVSTPDGIDGTPLEKAWPNDLYGFFQKLLLEAGITPSGVSDTVIASDYYDAALQLFTPPPVGAEMFWPGSTPPAGWLEEDGALYSMDTYVNLFDILGVKYGKNTGVVFTADFSTNILTSAAHGKNDGDIVTLSNSGGALPAGLAADTKYFIISSTTNTFQLSLTAGGAAVNFTDNGTGTHSFHDQFKVCDMRGEFPRGWDHGAGNDPDAASRTDRGDGTGGDVVGSKQADEFKLHNHTANYGSAGSNSAYYQVSGATTGLGNPINATGGNETRGRNVNKMFIIKH